MADLTTYDAALHVWYESQIEQQLNVEVNILELAEKAAQPWQGKKISIALELAYGEASTLLDGGALPPYTGVDLGEIEVTSGALVKRFRISGESLDAAPAGGTHAAAPIFDTEMRGVKVGMKITSNRLLLWGERCKGWILEKQATGLTLAPGALGTTALLAASAGTEEWSFDGDFTPFVNAGVTNNIGAVNVPANNAAWVRVRVFRNDTDAEILPTLGGGGTQLGTGVFVSAIDTVNETVRLSVIGDVVNSSITTLPGDANEGHTIALHDTTHIIVGAGAAINGLPFGTLISYVKEPRGMCGNLSDITHFTLDRGDASAIAGASEAQSSIIRADNALPGVRAALSMEMLQEQLDTIGNRSDTEPTHIICHRRQRQAYKALGQAVNTQKTDGSSKKAVLDGGFGGGVSYEGLPFYVSRHMARGAMIFYDKSNWSLYERARPKFRTGKGGAILEPLENSDNVQGTYIWRYNYVCKRPGANSVLIGLAI